MLTRIFMELKVTVSNRNIFAYLTKNGMLMESVSCEIPFHHKDVFYDKKMAVLKYIQIHCMYFTNEQKYLKNNLYSLYN